MSRSVLITGAAGFVGTALTRGFVKLGWEVTAVDRHFDPGGQDDAHEEHGVRRITADLTEREQLDLPASDVVIHGAWITSDPEVLGIQPSAYVGLNLRPLTAVLAHVRRSRPDAFAFLSSSGVFSAADGSGELTDRVTPTATSIYGALKRAAEELVFSVETSPRPAPPPILSGGDTRVHVVRLGYLFGPGEVARPSRTTVSLVARWMEATRSRRPLRVSSEDPRRDWTFVDDLAPALARLLDGPALGRPVHLCSPYVLRDREWAALIASRCPGVETASGPPASPAKAPMTPSDLPALEGFEWTAPAAGLEVLLETAGVS